MAHTLNRARPAGLTGMTVIAPLAGVVARVTAWNEARRTRNVLSRLSAHELNDIGLNRGDIDTIARRGF